jgi:hypothetical protein
MELNFQPGEHQKVVLTMHAGDFREVAVSGIDPAPTRRNHFLRLSF